MTVVPGEYLLGSGRDDDETPMLRVMIAKTDYGKWEVIGVPYGVLPRHRAHHDRLLIQHVDPDAVRIVPLERFRGMVRLGERHEIAGLGLGPISVQLFAWVKMLRLHAVGWSLVWSA